MELLSPISSIKMSHLACWLRIQVKRLEIMATNLSPMVVDVGKFYFTF